ncbi:hypothetical protein SAMN06265784_117108 [Paraburkholderia susongensis]|uniref:Ribokinase n=1 Tax=Paraburkholderia susongensis TaxID=1515439 RepID=A0A1X7M432_9BURK|nr:hypothetical protein SAMN06265784_117108 [Paraburkholderia susongensis]
MKSGHVAVLGSVNTDLVLRCAASISVTRHGAMASLPHAREMSAGPV